MPCQTAWRIPAEIGRCCQCCPRPELLAPKGETGLIGLLEGLVVHPRHAAKQGAGTLSAAAGLVWERFDGDVGTTWEDSLPAEVKKTLLGIHGIALISTRILLGDFGCSAGKERQIDVTPDLHLVRVFRRVGTVDDDSANEAIPSA